MVIFFFGGEVSERGKCPVTYYKAAWRLYIVLIAEPPRDAFARFTMGDKMKNKLR